MNKSKQYRVLGVMSGSSLDGLDLCDALICVKNDQWQYEIKHCWTQTIPKSLIHQLNDSASFNQEQLENLDISYGQWIGGIVSQYAKKKSEALDLVAIHGHTVFHEPAKGFSLQIGSGSEIAQMTNIPVVDNFRNADILKGGQGAPLVPVGEHYLFPEYQIFINLGGIANISHHREKITAWDIAPCNQVFNHFSGLLGKPFDEGGLLSQSGKLNDAWLNQLSELDYFKKSPPKSLANQWTENIISLCALAPKDALHTYTHFLAQELANAINHYSIGSDKLLITGGGAYHQFLINKLKEKCPNHQMIIPEVQSINYKEALIFAFLGLLRFLNYSNVFASVTGANADSCSGDIHFA